MAKLLVLINILILPKDKVVELNPYLNSAEIACKCKRKTCHYTLINQDLNDAFYRTRVAAGFALYLNSGFRCQAHNKTVGGVETSSHTTGNAIDISTEGLNRVQLSRLVAACRANFDYVKIYPNFIHCQLNPKKEDTYDYYATGDEDLSY